MELRAAVDEQRQPIEGYKLSEDGHVWSNWKPGPGSFLRETASLCRVVVDADGFTWLKLRVAHRERRPFKVHRLMAFAFLALPASEQTDVIHINHDPSDNRAANLRWATKKEAFEHSAKVSNRYFGSQGGKPKLSKNTAEKIRNCKAGTPMLAQQFNVTERAIRDIRAGRSWTETHTDEPKTPLA